MGADQIAVIRPALLELMDAVARNDPGASDLCATFTVDSDPDAWVQVMAGILNFSYPRIEEPLHLLQVADASSILGLTLQTFEAEEYVTFSHEPCAPLVLARFIDRFLSAVHDLPDDYGIEVEVESIT